MIEDRVMKIANTIDKLNLQLIQYQSDLQHRKQDPLVVIDHESYISGVSEENISKKEGGNSLRLKSFGVMDDDTLSLIYDFN